MKEALKQLYDLRERLFVAIEHSLAVDGHCKLYEGTFSIGFPNYFQRDPEYPYDRWTVSLDCYVVGPSRHYSWSGRTLMEAVQKASAEIGEWLKADEEWWEREGREEARLRLR